MTTAAPDPVDHRPADAPPGPPPAVPASGPGASAVVIVLAAGDGARFRAAGGADKLAARLATPAGTATVLDHVLAAVSASGLPFHVVDAAATRGIDQPGMGRSIALGVAATPDAGGWLIVPGDLPLLRPDTLRRVADALASGAAAVAPVFEGRRGHPVAFSAGCFGALCALRGDEGARSVLRGLEMTHVEVDDIGCVLDVDTPEALALAQRLALGSAAPAPLDPAPRRP